MLSDTEKISTVSSNSIFIFNYDIQYVFLSSSLTVFNITEFKLGTFYGQEIHNFENCTLIKQWSLIEKEV